MKIQKRTVTRLSLLFAFGLLVASALAALVNARALVAANDRVTHTYQALGELAQVLSLLAEAEAGQRGYIITGDPAYVAPFTASTIQIDSGLVNLRALTSDSPNQQARLTELEGLVARRLELLEQGIHLRETQGFAEAQRVVLSNTGKSLMDEIRDLIAAMEAEEEALLAARAEASRASARSTIGFIFGGTLLSGGVLLTIFLVLRDEIRQRRRTEAALAHESHLLHVIMDTLPDTIYFKDTASRFTRVNRSQARVLGLADARQAVGKTDLDFQAGDLARSFMAEEQTIIQSGRPLIDRVEYNPTPEGQPRWFSATKLPMLDEAGAVIGLVGISRDVTQRIQSEDALQRANDRLTQSLGALERQNRSLALLSELLDLLATCDTTEEAFGLIVRLGQRLMPAELGAVYLINSSRNLVEAVAVWGEQPLRPDEELFQPGDCWALRRGRLHWVNDVAGEAVCGHVAEGTKSGYVCVPMAAQGETLGLLHLRRGQAPDGPAAVSADGAYPLAVALAEHLSLALANLKLREKLKTQAIRDPLTGLFNRRYMEESLEREVVRATRRGATFGLVMIDLDHFKRFNDTFGHAAGDALLQAFGDYLRQSVRGEDIACRYGGEEFILLLTDATLEQARLRARRVLEGMAGLAVSHQGQPLGRVTLSMGLAAFPYHAHNVPELLRLADAALYRAKSEGRNRLVEA